MQSMGLGGCFIVTTYTQETGKAVSLVAREATAFEGMFGNVASITGPLSVAVPAEIKGYAALYDRYGCLSWRTLILCRKGFELTADLDRVIYATKYNIIKRTITEYRDIFVNSQTGELYVAGDIIRRPKKAQTYCTLRTVQWQPHY